MRKFVFGKPPDGLLQISDRVYVFNCCFGAQQEWSQEYSKLHVDRVIFQFRTTVPEARVLMCNFRSNKGTKTEPKAFNVHDIMHYPCCHLGSPVLKLEDMWRFLRSCESWLSSCGCHRDVILMHCERDAWPVLAFALGALMVFQKQCEEGGEKRALDVIYEKARRQLLHSWMTVNQIPSQLRYLRYISTWNGALESEWESVTLNNGVVKRLNCIVLRFMPKFGGGGSDGGGERGACGPMLRVYGCDPLDDDGNPKILYSTLQRGKSGYDYEQGDCDTIQVNINCHIKGDVLIESINLNGEMKREQTMFRVMFNVAFLESNMLLLNRDKIDVLWYAKDRFPKDFWAQILFSEMDASAAVNVHKNGNISCFEEEGLPVEAFSEIQEMFSYEDWMNPMEDPALNVLQQKRASPDNAIHEKLNTGSNQYIESASLLRKKGPQMPQENKNKANCFLSSNMENQFMTSAKQWPDNNVSRKEDKTDIISQERPSPFERTSEFSNCITDCTNLSKKLHHSDFALSDSVDTSSSGSISPQTPPPLPSFISSVKEVHDSHPYKDSHPHHYSPSKSRQLTEETKSQSQERSHLKREVSHVTLAL